MDQLLQSLAESVSTAPPLVMLLLVFLGGVVSSASPCVLATVPLVVGYVGGQTTGDRWRAFGYSLAFVLDDVAACVNHGFWFEIFTDLGVMVEKFGNTHFLIGNADTRILLSGKREKIRAEVERCISAGKMCPGYFMVVSNHIPPNTPVESALYYNQVYEELCRR